MQPILKSSVLEARLEQWRESSPFFVEQLLHAPAKVNLRLKLLGRRADGYHLLSMLNVSTSLADEVTITLMPGKDFSIEVVPSDVAIGPNSKNLIYRAWHEFWGEFCEDGTPCGVNVRLAKQIPIGGGLGGGSSDAGAMLRYLVNIFGPTLRELLELSDPAFNERVMRLAVKVGADVPYSYRGGLCWVSGIGDVVVPIQTRCVLSDELIIVMPPVSVPTEELYAQIRVRYPVLPNKSDERVVQYIESGGTEPLSSVLENDLEGEIVRFSPMVGKLLMLARRFYPHSTSITGSGAAIFSVVSAADRGGIEEFTHVMKSEGMRVYRVHVV